MSFLSSKVVRVVYKWAHEKSFANIMTLMDIREGVIVKCIQRLNILLQDIRKAAVIIGYSALKDNMDQALTKIKRDIVFTPSL